MPLNPEEDGVAALRIYDTLTREKREFVPVHPGKVGMYVCGMTVQNKPHVGHIRASLSAEVMRRYLEHLGYQVTYVYNFTDVDDKIIERATAEGVEWQHVSERNIEAFLRFADLHNIKPASLYPRATRHIGEMHALIARLIEKGHAYAAGGDVYFDVRSKPDYGKLSGRRVDEMREGYRIEPGEAKRDPLDFALWKGAKPGEPAWDSPWGPGRPGWHIECSAMAMKHLGETFDIHGGGKDLVFPHHENEIAQSEGVTGKPFARCWIHNGFVNIDNEKMSKSLGNFFTLREVLKTVHPEALRFFFASSHYRSPIDYSDRNLAEAKAGLTRLYETKRKKETFEAARIPATPVPAREDFAAIREAKAKFEKAMDDDFNTAAALGHLFDAVRALNRLAPAGPVAEKEKAGQFLAGYAILEPLFGVLGLLQS